MAELEHGSMAGTSGVEQGWEVEDSENSGSWSSAGLLDSREVQYAKRRQLRSPDYLTATRILLQKSSEVWGNIWTVVHEREVSLCTCLGDE